MDEVRVPLQQSFTTHAPTNYSFNISIWAVALCAHAACKNFAGLFAVRLILGMCEGSITAGFMIVSSMFYTRNEQTLRVGYWCKLHLTCICEHTDSRNVASPDERNRSVGTPVKIASRLNVHANSSPDHFWLH